MNGAVHEFLRRLRAFIRHHVLARARPKVAAAFDDAAYLDANPDVAAAVKRGEFHSGMHHFALIGKDEHRRTGTAPAAAKSLKQAKQDKLERIAPLLRKDMLFAKTDRHYDFLTDELRSQFSIVDTSAVSSNDYDAHVLDLIENCRDGLILDCGAGKRAVYYENVVNFEIVAYETTDVRGVGEVLPFVDGAFDAVISIAVLEHVKDPFRCAREIARVLKPGGQLICCVPFLQPYHGYPHHYYNMTHQGLQNLFADVIAVDRVEVYASVLPIWSLAWIVRRWAGGLKGAARRNFLDMRLRDLLVPTADLLAAPFVTGLSKEKNLELASACVLFGRKPE